MKGLDVFQENNYDRKNYFNTLKYEKHKDCFRRFSEIKYSQNYFYGKEISDSIIDRNV